MVNVESPLLELFIRCSDVGVRSPQGLDGRGRENPLGPESEGIGI